MNILSLYNCEDSIDAMDLENIKSKQLTNDIAEEDRLKMEAKWNKTPDEQIDEHLKTYCTKETEKDAEIELKLFMAAGGVTEEDINGLYIGAGDMGKLSIKVEEVE